MSAFSLHNANSQLLSSSVVGTINSKAVVRSVYFFIEVYFIFNVLTSSVQQSDSVMCVYKYTHTFFFLFFSINGLLQEMEYISMCRTVGPCCLPILYTTVCIW